MNMKRNFKNSLIIALSFGFLFSAPTSISYAEEIVEEENIETKEEEIIAPAAKEPVAEKGAQEVENPKQDLINDNNGNKNTNNEIKQEIKKPIEENKEEKPTPSNVSNINSKDFFKKAFEEAAKEQGRDIKRDQKADKEDDKNKDNKEKKDKEDKKDSEKETKSPLFSSSFKSASYNPVRKVRVDNFRFHKVSKIYSFAKKDIKVYDSIDKNKKEIGDLKKGNVAFILSKIDDNYSYIESGDVRGFVENKDLISKGEEFDKIISKIKEIYKSDDLDEIEPKDFYGKTSVKPYENKAFDYIRITTKDVLVKTRYFLSQDKLEIKEEKEDSSKTVGTLDSSSIGYVIEEEDEKSPWIYIESGDVRGFIEKNKVSYGEDIQEKITSQGSSKYKVADKKVELKDNKARFYSLKSTKEPIKTTNGQELVDYARQFVGNPYVWGGTDPVNGADCSGFAGTIYRTFGYNLPRTAEEQAYVGEKISLSEAKPGDLLFNMDESGHIYHVTMYAGDGRTVEAANPDVGIINGVVLNDVCWGTRLLNEKEVIKEEDLKEKTNITFPITSNTTNMNLSTLNWDTINEENSNIKDFAESKNIGFDENGYGIINNRYLVSANTSFGKVGDLIDLYLEDGTMVPAIIGETNFSGTIGFVNNKDGQTDKDPLNLNLKVTRFTKIQ